MKHSLIHSLTIFLTLLALSFSAVGVTPAYAATFTVTNNLNNGAGSLRQAIADAASGDTITFSSGLSGAVIYLASTLTLSKNVTIDGSALAFHININGDADGNNGPGDVRIFYVNSGVTATLDSLTITNGYANGGSGGGIYNEGTLTVMNSTLSGNSATNLGGGIYNEVSSTLTVTNSTLSGNSATNLGGGIYNEGTLTVMNSTLSGNNTNTDGGGIYNMSTLTVINSTLSGNNANTDGGGIYNDDGIANVYNTSIIFNGADADADINGGNGGGVLNNDGGGAVFNLRNTLLAGNNVANAPVYEDCSGTLNSYGQNLFWDVSGCTVNIATGSWGILNALNTLSPFLQNNGGPTWTHALLLGSNAIDGGDPVQGCIGPDSNPLATDQRGFARVVGVRCDIGAYESPLTLTLKSIAANDGWILESTETSGVGGTMNTAATTFNLGDDAQDKQYRAILHFDTSSLADNAVITKVTLKIKKQGLVGIDPFTVLGGLRVDIRKPFFGTTVGLAIGDFQAAAGKSTVATFGVTPLSNWYSAVLNGPGRAYVNKTGTTQFRLLFAADDNNNNIANYMKFFSGNAGVATRPQLIIEYKIP